MYLQLFFEGFALSGLMFFETLVCRCKLMRNSSLRDDFISPWSVLFRSRVPMKLFTLVGDTLCPAVLEE